MLPASRRVATATPRAAAGRWPSALAPHQSGHRPDAGPRPRARLRQFSSFQLSKELETFEHATLSKADFIKNIRKPLGLYSESLDQIKREIGAMDELPGNGSLQLLNEKEKEAYLVPIFDLLVFVPALIYC